MPEPGLELLQTMMQRALDSRGLLRGDVSLRRRVGRVEHAMRRDHGNFIKAAAARRGMPQ